MKIAFLSVRGIPNDYGGFEEFAEHISVGLAKKGHDVTVYSPHFHPYKEEWYKGVRIKHIYSPEKWLGSSVGSFFYDFGSLRDALRHEDYDIIYEAGYTSIIPAFMWYDIRKLRRPVFTTNMDGLEYKRSKFNKLVQRFILWEESVAVRYSHHLVSDNHSIRRYFLDKYGKDSTYLAYGANIPEKYNATLLEKYGLRPYDYYLLIARMEPENNIAMAIEGFLASPESKKRKMVVIGKLATPHGKALKKRFGNNRAIVFTDGLYDTDRVNAMRHFSKAYFHGHSVGGTNPSLLQAMACGAFVVANDNIFNRSVLADKALYFKSAADITALLDNIEAVEAEHRADFTAANLEAVRTTFSWDKLVDQHEEYFMRLIKESNNRK